MFMKVYKEMLCIGAVAVPNVDCQRPIKNTQGQTKAATPKSITVAQNLYSVIVGSSFCSGLTSSGVFFGNGTTPPTENDYCPSGSIITTIITSKQVNATADENGYTLTADYVITNTGASPITISEVGIINYQNQSSGNVFFLAERTLLDNPVTIQPNSVGKVVYTIRYDYPT